MKTIHKILILSGLLVAGLYFSVPFAVGAVLEPRLEKKLTDLFGMPVTIDDLRVWPVSGEVRSGRVCFRNIQPFSETPHLDVRKLAFDIRFPELLNRRVIIGRIVMTQPVFVIERTGSEDGPVNNLSAWVHHMKGDDADEPETQEDSSRSGSWTVSIGKIIIQDGTFRMENRADVGGFFNMTFSRLDGHLSRFLWPTPDPAQIPQGVKLKGLIGARYPAPFTLEGNANFATGELSFDLKGAIPKGDLLEYPYLWDDLPIVIKRGLFALATHGICKRDHLEVKNSVMLESLDVGPSSTVKGTFWGMPMKAGIAFLKDERKISLEIPVEGDISNPKFHIQKAFRQAFQGALERNTINGFKLLKEGPAMMVQTTENLAMKVLPGKMLQQMTQLSTTVAEGTISRAKDSVMGGLKNPIAAKGQTEGTGADE